MAKGKKSKYLDDAQKYVQKQQYDKAIKEYIKAHEEDSKDVKVAQKLGDLYLKVKNQKDCIKFFRIAGSIYARDGFHQRAIAVYRQVLEIAPDAFEVRLEVANLYRKLGLMGEAVPHYKEALKHFEEVSDKDKCLDIIKNLIDIEPHSVNNRIKLAELYLKSNQREQGYTEFKKAAEELKSSGRWEDLAKLYEKLTKADPNNYDNLFGYGEALLQKGDLEKSHESFAKALKYKPDDPEILDRLVIVATRLQDVEKAVSYLRKKAQIAEAKKDNAEARLCYQKILKYYPGDEAAKRCLEALGGGAATGAKPTPPPLRKPAAAPKATPPPDEETIALESAEEEAPAPKVAPKKAPTPPPPPPSKARKQAPLPTPPTMAKGSPSSDTVEEKEEIPSEDQIPRLLTEADVYLRYGLIDKANQYVRRVLRAAPDKHEALRLSGLIYKEQGRIKDAAETLLLAASAARTKGDDDDARAYLEEVINLEPDNSEAHKLLEELNAGVEIDVGVEGEAAAEFEEEEAPAPAEKGEAIFEIEGDVSADMHIPLSGEEHIELEGDINEPFKFVEEAAAEEELTLVEEESPAPSVQRSMPTAPPPTVEEAQLFDFKDEDTAPALAEEELTLNLDEIPPAPKVKAAPEVPVYEDEEESLALEEAPEVTLEEEPSPVPKVKAAIEAPVFEIEEEAPPKPVAEETELHREVIAGSDIAILEEMEDEGEEEEEEEVELEEIDMALEETAPVASETSETISTDSAPVSAPSKSWDLLEDEWADEEAPGGGENLEEVSLESDSDLEAEAMEEHEEVGTSANEALGADALEEETIIASEPGESLIDEHEELIPHDIHAVAEAADEAWGDALVEEEPAQMNKSVHPVMEGMAEAADKILGEVFAEKSSDAGEVGEGVFDLSSVLGDDTSGTATQPEGTVDDLDEVLGSFRERVKAEFGGDAETHFNLGIAYKEMGLFRDAIHAFETAMRNGYSPSDCLNMIGLSFMDINEYGKAERVFREGLAQDNLQEHEKLGLSFDLGLTLERQNRLEEALEFYRGVEKLNPYFRDVSQIIKDIDAKLKPKSVAEEPRAKMRAGSRSKVSYI